MAPQQLRQTVPGCVTEAMGHLRTEVVTDAGVVPGEAERDDLAGTHGQVRRPQVPDVVPGQAGDALHVVLQRLPLRGFPARAVARVHAHAFGAPF